MIHILSANQSGAKVADTFTKGNGADVFRSQEFTVLKRRGAERDGGILEPPLLAAKGITKVLRCQLLEDNGLVEVGDHMLVLGKVVSIIEAAPSDLPGQEHGLCYSDGQYREVGGIIEVGEPKA
jgi:hypothetical protein